MQFLPQHRCRKFSDIEMHYVSVLMSGDTVQRICLLHSRKDVCASDSSHSNEERFPKGYLAFSLKAHLHSLGRSAFLHPVSPVVPFGFCRPTE
jgi:hypothetical protein